MDLTDTTLSLKAELEWAHETSMFENTNTNEKLACEFHLTDLIKLFTDEMPFLFKTTDLGICCMYLFIKVTV
ncbi:MAG: hypothetical protein Q8904_13350 [Bacteroidota bacterium]|nr:hypothetical protein [Bacteroidota bacterium]